MNTLKAAAVVAILAGSAAVATPATAQPWGYGHGHGHPYGYGHVGPGPQWVDPRILRKQAQLRERFVEKYGYVQPQHHGGAHHGWHGRGHGRSYPHHGPRHLHGHYGYW